MLRIIFLGVMIFFTMDLAKGWADSYTDFYDNMLKYRDSPLNMTSQDLDKRIQRRVASCLRAPGTPKVLGDFFDRWSLGPTAQSQLIRYDLAKEKAAFSTNAGVGAAIRFYSMVDIIDPVARKQYSLPIHQIQSKCRPTSLNATSVYTDQDEGKFGDYLFSITPMIYATELEGQEFTVQPALQFGFFNDVLNFGAGFNLTGPDKGNVFLLFSIGIGFLP